MRTRVLRCVLLIAAGLGTNAVAAPPIKVVGFDHMSCRACVASKGDAALRISDSFSGRNEAITR